MEVGVDAPELVDAGNAEPGEGAADAGEIASLAGLSGREDDASTIGLAMVA
jgi:hypothetical protein